MKVNADSEKMSEAERREAVEDAAGLDDPADRDDEEMVTVVEDAEGGE